MQNKILVTGAAGFIGYHLSLRLCNEGYNVYGVDNLNSYYDVNLKIKRLDLLKNHTNFQFEKIDLVEREKLFNLFKQEKFNYVINLAAQAGVRYSIENPFTYSESNLTGFLNILEACRNFLPQHLIFASSSSVYGANKKIPFMESDNVDHPISLYAATKKSNELLAHTYAHLYKIPVTGLRFFTVYGPFGRPDMAYFKFVKSIYNGEAIDIYNNGNLKRDFTFIDDIVESIYRLIPIIPTDIKKLDGLNSDPSVSFAPYSIYNIGNNQPVELMYFINIIERITGIEAKKNFLEMQLGDVEVTYANIDKLSNTINFIPHTSIELGLEKFISWFNDYYNK